jgi:hypothetical protein
MFALLILLVLIFVISSKVNKNRSALTAATKNADMREKQLNDLKDKYEKVIELYGNR